MTELSAREMARYDRHLLLPEIGKEGQLKLKSASVLVVGAGGLGCPALQYLASAGVGRIVICDDDKVELSNLQRQILHNSHDIGINKAQNAKEKLLALNPEIQVEAIDLKLSAKNALNLVGDVDLVLDASDNFATRYLLSDACVLEEKPLVSASIYRFEGQLSVFCDPRSKGPCYRCLFEKEPPKELAPNCAQAGVLGVLPGILGTLQAMEALKWILQIGECAISRLVLVDTLRLKQTELKFKERRNCRCRSANFSLDVSKSSSADSQKTLPIQEIGSGQLLKLLEPEGSGIQLLDVREEEEREAIRIEPSFHIPLSKVSRATVEEAGIELTEEIYIYCRSGKRSLQACETLKKEGLNSVVNLRGGILDYCSVTEERIKTKP